MDGNQIEILKKALSTYGEEQQLNMVIEECSELIQAICKHRREPNGTRFDNLVEEIADVEIMIFQAKLIVGENSVAVIRDKKIEKLGERLKNG